MSAIQDIAGEAIEKINRAAFRRLEAENKRLRDELQDEQKWASHYAQQADAARAEALLMRQDAKRYRWLTDCAGRDFEAMAPYQLIGRMSDRIDDLLERGKT